MNDLWASIGGEFTQLIQAVSRILSNRDAEFEIGRALEQADVPWSEMAQTFRKEPSFPKNIVRLALASDCLHIMVHSVLADGEVEEEELQVAYSLAQPLAKILGSLGRYRAYAALDIDEVGAFLQAFIDDSNWFGGSADAQTHYLGLYLCGFASSLKCDIGLYLTYESIAKSILSGVFDGSPRTTAEIEHAKLVNDLLARLRPNLSGESEKTNPRKSKADSSGSAFVTEDDDLLSELMADSFSKLPSDENITESISPEAALDQAMADLESLIGLEGVKSEVKRLTSFLTIQQRRREHGLRESAQTLHFVFTGNPGTGKTTVARIVSKILYGFRLLKSTNVIECDRSDLVGGYLGQTAIKTDEKIESALDGVLFIDEAYTLAGDALAYGHGDMYGDEAISTLLKRMEDSRDRLVVIAAGYPKPMERFIKTNPGLESRFTRYINFEDYTIADLCLIFEKFCRDAEYSLSVSGRAFASILFTVAYNQRDERFGNARFIRNVFERATSLHSERLAEMPHERVNKEMLVTLDGNDLSFEFVKNVNRTAIDVSNARWAAECPGCGSPSKGTMTFLGQRVTCKKCNQTFMFPWWCLQPETVDGVSADLLRACDDRRGVIEPAATPKSSTASGGAVTNGTPGDLPEFDGWSDDPRRGQELLQEGLQHLKHKDGVSAIRCFDAAIRIDWDGSNPSSQSYFLCRAKAFEMNGEPGPVEALSEYNSAAHAWLMGHYLESEKLFINAMKLDPDFLWAPNNLAWRYATCSDASARNDKEAVKHALHACRRSDWHCWSFIDTLSASYAEAGDFGRAISCSERALLMAPPRAKNGIQEMLRHFRAGKPYRGNS